MSKFSTIVLGLAVAALVMTGLAAAAPVSAIDSSAMLGNEAEDAIAVNPTDVSNVVTMATLPDAVAGLSVNVSPPSVESATRTLPLEFTRYVIQRLPK